jgi:hypothetical protein
MTLCRSSPMAAIRHQRESFEMALKQSILRRTGRYGSILGNQVPRPAGFVRQGEVESNNKGQRRDGGKDCPIVTVLRVWRDQACP